MTDPAATTSPYVIPPIGDSATFVVDGSDDFSALEVLRRALLHAYGEHQECSDRNCLHRESEWEDAETVARGLLVVLSDYGYQVEETRP